MIGSTIIDSTCQAEDSSVPLDFDPVFAAQVERLHQVPPATLAVIVESFLAETPMAELAASTGLSQDILNRLFARKWQAALSSTSSTSKDRKESAARSMAIRSEDHVSAELAHQARELASLRIGAADICSWLGISPKQLSWAKAHARSSASADAVHVLGSSVN